MLSWAKYLLFTALCRSAKVSIATVTCPDILSHADNLLNLEFQISQIVSSLSTIPRSDSHPWLHQPCTTISRPGVIQRGRHRSLGQIARPSAAVQVPALPWLWTRARCRYVALLNRKSQPSKLRRMHLGRLTPVLPCLRTRNMGIIAPHVEHPLHSRSRRLTGFQMVGL